MKKFLLLLLVLLPLCAAVQAQSYTTFKMKGVQLYNQGKYKEALSQFNHALTGSIDKDQAKRDSELKRYISLCHTKVVKRKPGTGTSGSSSGKTNAATARHKVKIEDLRALNGEKNGELGVRIKCSFSAQNMKGSTVHVKSTFTINNRTLSYEDGNPDYIDYIEFKEVCVSDNVEVTENEDYKTVELHIPYAAFRLSDFYEQEFKAHLEIFDGESSEVDGDAPLAKADKRFIALPVSIFIDGTTDDTRISPSASGGYSTHNVRTGGEPYNFDGVPEWCHIENKTASSFQIRVDKNYSTLPRSCEISVFVGNVTGGSNKVRFYINQEGGSGESAQKAVATIYKLKSSQIKQNHVEADGVKYLQVCPRVALSGMRGQTVYLGIFFYQNDDETPLVDKNGNQVKVYDEALAEYENCEWEQWCLRIPNNAFLNAANATSTVVFDIVLKDEDGNDLAREEGYQIQAR